MPTDIQAHGLTKAFRSGVVAVSGLDLRVERGTVYGLIGRNGAGKTTALKLLMGLLRPDKGEARVLGRTLWEAPPEHRQKVAYVSQSQQVPEWMSLEELGRYAAHFYSAWQPDMLKEQARRWELPLRMPISKLSGGNQRLAALAMALATRPDVLLLDEPAAGLDLGGREELVARLADLAADPDSPALVLVTHHVEEIPPGFSHCLIMAEGQVVAAGLLDDVMTAEHLSAAFGQSIAVDVIDGRYFARRARVRPAHRRRV
jgi:iron complex transport system ATP-binding protein